MVGYMEIGSAQGNVYIFSAPNGESTSSLSQIGEGEYSVFD
jgi:hypothetical protein